MLPLRSLLGYVTDITHFKTSIILYIRIEIITHGVQEQTIGLKKCSRLLTWEKVFFDALAINLWQKLKNRLGNIEFKA